MYALLVPDKSKAPRRVELEDSEKVEETLDTAESEETEQSQPTGKVGTDVVNYKVKLNTVELEKVVELSHPTGEVHTYVGHSKESINVVEPEEEMVQSQPIGEVDPLVSQSELLQYFLELEESEQSQINGDIVTNFSQSEEILNGVEPEEETEQPQSRGKGYTDFSLSEETLNEVLAEEETEQSHTTGESYTDGSDNEETVNLVLLEDIELSQPTGEFDANSGHIVETVYVVEPEEETEQSLSTGESYTDFSQSEETLNEVEGEETERSQTTGKSYIDSSDSVETLNAVPPEEEIEQSQTIGVDTNIRHVEESLNLVEAEVTQLSQAEGEGEVDAIDLNRPGGLPQTPVTDVTELSQAAEGVDSGFPYQTVELPQTAVTHVMTVSQAARGADSGSPDQTEELPHITVTDVSGQSKNGIAVQLGYLSHTAGSPGTSATDISQRSQPGRAVESGYLHQTARLPGTSATDISGQSQAAIAVQLGYLCHTAGLPGTCATSVTELSQAAGGVNSGDPFHSEELPQITITDVSRQSQSAETVQSGHLHHTAEELGTTATDVLEQSKVTGGIHFEYHLPTGGADEILSSLDPTAPPFFSFGSVTQRSSSTVVIDSSDFGASLSDMFSESFASAQHSLKTHEDSNNELCDPFADFEGAREFMQEFKRREERSEISLLYTQLQRIKFDLLAVRANIHRKYKYEIRAGVYQIEEVLSVIEDQINMLDINPIRGVVSVQQVNTFRRLVISLTGMATSSVQIIKTMLAGVRDAFGEGHAMRRSEHHNPYPSAFVLCNSEIFGEQMLLSIGIESQTETLGDRYSTDYLRDPDYLQVSPLRRVRSIRHQANRRERSVSPGGAFAPIRGLSRRGEERVNPIHPRRITVRRGEERVNPMEPFFSRRFSAHRGEEGEIPFEPVFPMTISLQNETLAIPSNVTLNIESGSPVPPPNVSLNFVPEVPEISRENITNTPSTSGQVRSDSVRIEFKQDTPERQICGMSTSMIIPIAGASTSIGIPITGTSTSVGRPIMKKEMAQPKAIAEETDASFNQPSTSKYKESERTYFEGFDKATAKQPQENVPQKNAPITEPVPERSSCESSSPTLVETLNRWRLSQPSTSFSRGATLSSKLKKKISQIIISITPDRIATPLSSCATVITGTTVSVLSMAFVDNMRAILACEEGLFTVNAATPHIVYKISSSPEYCKKVVYREGPTRSLLLSGTQAGLLTLIDSDFLENIAGGYNNQPLRIVYTADFICSDFDISSDGQLLVVASENDVIVFDFNTRGGLIIKYKVPFKSKVQAVTFITRDSVLVNMSPVVLLNIRTREVIELFSSDNYTQMIARGYLSFSMYMSDRHLETRCYIETSEIVLWAGRMIMLLLDDGRNVNLKVENFPMDVYRFRGVVVIVYNSYIDILELIDNENDLVYDRFIHREFMSCIKSVIGTDLNQTGIYLCIGYGQIKTIIFLSIVDLLASLPEN